MSARERAQEAWEASQKRRRGRRSARKERRSGRKEKRQVRRAVRRSKIWGAADAWWSLRQDIANDPKAKKRIRRVALLLNPIAGAIAAAALEIDRVVAPTALEFIEEKQAVSRAILQEMVDAGRITEAEAGILAVQVDQQLANGSAAPSAPRPRTLPPRVPVGSAAPPAALEAAAPVYWPLVAGIIAAIFILRGKP